MLQLQIGLAQMIQQQMFQQQMLLQQQAQRPVETANNEDEDQRTLFCANLDERVDDELLYELFLQAGPLENVRLPKQRSFAFITYTHNCSPVYAMHLFQGLMLFGKPLVIKYNNRTAAPPLTHRLLPPDWGVMDKKPDIGFPHAWGNYPMGLNDNSFESKVQSNQQPIGDHRRRDRSPIHTRNDRNRDSAHDWTHGPDSSRRDRMGKTRLHHSTGPYERHRDSSRERDRDRDRDHDRNRDRQDRHRRQDKRSNHYI